MSPLKWATLYAGIRYKSLFPPPFLLPLQLTIGVAVAMVTHVTPLLAV